MKKEKGVALIPLLIIVAVVVVLVYLVSQGKLKSPVKVPGLSQTKAPTVSLQTEYQNPFDKNAQYVNPFSQYKNPFDTLR